VSDIERPPTEDPDGPDGEITPPTTITCVDCGGVAHLISAPRPDEDATTGFRSGDILAYRCEDCLDRWDVEFD
jgi:hypothetical protein